MKVVQINATCGQGSTGKICVAVSRLLSGRDIENYILYSNGNSDYPLGIKYTTDRYIQTQALKSRIFANYGYNSKSATRKLITELKRIKPDIVHIHNIHSHNCDLKMLFEYFRSSNVKLFWTFHDCWAFTGYCTYFTMAKCDKWKTQCRDCPQSKSFSWFLDKSSALYKRKKQLFKDLDLTIITPSQWLADLVKSSFLKEYPVRVIHNGIDLEVFKPTASDFRMNHGLEQKHIVLGVSYNWDKRKGIDVFVDLSKRLGNKYKIVLVGTDSCTDQLLPENILSLHRTQSQQELAQIYSAADVFVIPTREENYPTVNMEAIACGTPVVTFRTGGSPEIIDDTCGMAVECDDNTAMLYAIKDICENNKIIKKDVSVNASRFNEKDRFNEYVEGYIKS